VLACLLVLRVCGRVGGLAVWRFGVWLFEAGVVLRRWKGRLIDWAVSWAVS
jgi:hypothetical protein